MITPFEWLAKGHATENDFLLAVEGARAPVVTPEDVRRLCNRHAGIGADGLLLARPATAAGYPTSAEWFMDYRNADGSLAEMCGNGIRVFAHFLREEGLLTGTGPWVIATRGGERTVWHGGTAPGGDEYIVDMGDYGFPGGTAARSAGFDVAVGLSGMDQRPGLRVTMPNPHTVVALESLEQLREVDLRGAVYDPAPPEGTNLEVVVPLGERIDGGSRVGMLAMRVLERGVGETRSCGTGCCAAAAALREWAGPESPDRWDVRVPGGTVRVDLRDGRALLTGPALLVARVGRYEGRA
nr:diaminopimelate epimerase [Actinomycetales bacterium]